MLAAQAVVPRRESYQSPENEVRVLQERAGKNKRKGVLQSLERALRGFFDGAKEILIT
jgi:hypothetical protein